MGNLHTQMWVCQRQAGVDISHYASIGFKVCNCSKKDADTSAGLQMDPLLEVMPQNSRKCCNCWTDRSRGYFDAWRFPREWNVTIFILWGFTLHAIQAKWKRSSPAASMQGNLQSVLLQSWFLCPMNVKKISSCSHRTVITRGCGNVEDQTCPSPSAPAAGRKCLSAEEQSGKLHL